MIDLRSVTQIAADSIGELMKSRGIEFAIEIDPEPLWVDGDPSRLQQIQANLLSNAAKYTPSEVTSCFRQDVRTALPWCG